MSSPIRSVIGIKRAIRVGVYFGAKAYPKDEGFENVVKAFYGGKRPFWHKGDTWLGDLFASVCNELHLEMNEYEYYRDTMFTMEPESKS